MPTEDRGKIEINTNISGWGMIFEDLGKKRKIGHQKGKLFHSFTHFLPKTFC